MNAKQKILLLGLLSIIFLLALASIRHKTAVYDEPVYLGYGKQLLQLDPGRLNAGPLPFSALNAVPATLAGALPPGRVGDFLGGLTAARLATVLFSVLLAYYVFRWTKELYGLHPAFGALLLYGLSPTIIAHSRLVTSDLYAAGMMTISIYYFWKFIGKGGWKYASISALAAGTSQLTKYSCILLYPVFSLIVLAADSKEWLGFLKAGDWRGLIGRLKSFLLWAVFFVAVGVVVINVGFAFQGSFRPFSAYDFRSGGFRSLQAASPFPARLPVPLPSDYLAGIDWGKAKEKSGEGFGYMYLFGELRKTGGFKDYYLYAWLYKVPIAFQLIVIFSLVSYFTRRRRSRFLKDELYLLGPAVFWLLYFSFIVKVHLGIRYLLPIFPLLIVFCGGFLARWDDFSRAFRVVLIVLFIYLAGSVISYFPHFLSYFNEFVWDRRKAYKILADSNLDWGQNERYLERYVEKHPEAHVNPRFPVSGRIVVSVNDLVGVWEPGRYRWLRENFDPVGQIAYSYLIFDVPVEKLIEVLYLQDPRRRPRIFEAVEE